MKSFGDETAAAAAGLHLESGPAPRDADGPRIGAENGPDNSVVSSLDRNESGGNFV